MKETVGRALNTVIYIPAAAGGQDDTLSCGPLV